MSFTVVFFHAHPDDEALLTGGTMARLAAEGHRVVLVVATAGEAGLASTHLFATSDLATVRLAELSRSADVLGCARVVMLGYADSGMSGERLGSDPNAFTAVPVETSAGRLAEILGEEAADVLTIYDPAGGYGHPDHIQVHRVGLRAAELAGTRSVLEATIDRSALQRVLRPVGWLKRNSPELAVSRFDAAYTHPDRLTHRVNVRRFSGQKRAAMRAHSSQAAADDSDRTLAWFLRLPRLVFRLAFGREWFVEQGRTPAKPLLDDLLASLR